MSMSHGISFQKTPLHLHSIPSIKRGGRIRPLLIFSKMPGIIAFRRRWMSASDELVFPFGISFVLRVAWLVLLSIMFGIHRESLKPTDAGIINNPEMECKGKVSIYLVGYISLLFIIAIMDFLICYASSRGSVFEVEKRSAVVPLLYVRLALFIIEIAWLALGIYWIFVDDLRYYCHSVPTKRLSQGVVIFNILFLIGVLISVYISFDPAGKLWSQLHASKSRKSQYGAINRQIRAKYEKKWEKSCKAIFCCTKVEGSTDNIFGFVSGLLSEYFQEYMDLVPSDILAGLILLRRHQKILESHRINRFLSDKDYAENEDAEEAPRHKHSITVHRHQKTNSAKAFNYKNLNESKTLTEITHFSSYALAIYGWPFYLFDSISCGACTLCCKVRCCASCCRPSGNEFLVMEDNCCECNLAATKLFLKDHDHQIIHISYKDDVYKPPFFIAVDHKKKSVVISCRGTLSLKDVLTDVMIEEARIPVENGDPNWMGHKGMIQAALYVLEIIDKEQLLEKAFNSDDEKGTKSYNLVIVGHSLGAGVASILSFLLRPKYPSLTCFAYSAVGATFNYDASVYARDFIYSIVVGKDVIGRLNLHTLDELRYMIIELLQRNRLPKWKILRGCICQCMLCCQSSSKNSHEDYLDYEFHDIPKYNPESSKRYYMGGKVVHIVKTQSIYPRFFGKKQAVYEAVWADVEDFQCILISNLMWRDHVPDTVKDALRRCCPEVGSLRTNGQILEETAQKEEHIRESHENVASSDKDLQIPEDEMKLLCDSDKNVEISPAEPESNSANANKTAVSDTTAEQIDIAEPEIESPDGQEERLLVEMA